jgi:hypothetical protein
VHEIQPRSRISSKLTENGEIKRYIRVVSRYTHQYVIQLEYGTLTNIVMTTCGLSRKEIIGYKCYEISIGGDITCTGKDGTCGMAFGDHPAVESTPGTGTTELTSVDSDGITAIDERVGKYLILILAYL